MSVGPRVLGQEALNSLFQQSILNKYVRAHAFPSHWVRVPVVLKVLQNSISFVAEPGTQNHGVEHEVVSDSAEELLRHLLFREVMQQIVHSVQQLRPVLILF